MGIVPYTTLWKEGDIMYKMVKKGKTNVEIAKEIIERFKGFGLNTDYIASDNIQRYIQIPPMNIVKFHAIAVVNNKIIDICYCMENEGKDQVDFISCHIDALKAYMDNFYLN